MKRLGVTLDGSKIAFRPDGSRGLVATRRLPANHCVLRVPLSSCLRPCMVPHNKRYRQNQQSAFAHTLRQMRVKFPAVADWYAYTRDHMEGVGLSSNTTFPSDHTASIGAFEAAVALAATEAAVIKQHGVEGDTPMGVLVGEMLPITSFLIHGTEDHRKQTLSQLDFTEGDAEVDRFHAGFICIESIAKNLSDVLHQRYDRGGGPGGYDEQMIAIVNAALLAVRSKVLWLPHTLYNSTDAALQSHLSDPQTKGTISRGVSRSGRRQFLQHVVQGVRYAERIPIVAPGVSHIKQHLDTINNVNVRVYVDVLGGEVVAETVESVREGAELFQPYLPPSIAGNEMFLPTSTNDDDDNINGSDVKMTVSVPPCSNHRRPARRGSYTTTAFPVSPRMRMVSKYGRTPTATTLASSSSPTALPLDDEDVSTQDNSISPILNLVSRYGRLNV